MPKVIVYTLWWSLLMVSLMKTVQGRPMVKFDPKKLQTLEPKGTVKFTPLDMPPREKRFVTHSHFMGTGWGSVKCTTRTGYNLAISGTGRVYAVKHDGDPSARLRRITLDAGIIAIKSTLHHRYLAINYYGRVITTTRLSEENHFFEEMRENSYTTFKSARFHRRDWYLGINGHGRVTKVRQLTVRRRQRRRRRRGLAKSIQFVVRPVR